MSYNVPEILKSLPNWVVWKSPSKIPYNPHTGHAAKANDSTTWVPFTEALAASDPLCGGEYTGIGFELGGTSIVGIDFDDAVNSKGITDPYVLEILKLLGNPYTEKSPSGNGLHAFVECKNLPEGGRKLSTGHAGIEIYHGQEGGRYFTITGDHFSGSGVPKIEDISLPYLLITQSRDKKFKKLWLGDPSDYGNDDSKADFALLLRLAVLTQNNPTKMDEYFGASGLGQREKWTDRTDYSVRTIKAAIQANRTGKNAPDIKTDIEFHTPELPDPSGDYVLAPAEGQEDGWFPLGDVSLIGGASGTGKTSLIFELLHKQKQGYPVLGHRTNKYSFFVLAYDRGKNAFARTLRRLKLLPSDIPTKSLPLAFGTAAVQNVIDHIEKMDPLPNVIYVEGLDMLIDDANKKSTVSPFMRQLQDVAAHFHIALICSLGAPKTKRGEDYAAKRDHLSGSEAWGRNCETVCILEFSEDDDGTGNRREFTVLPRNAPAEKFSLEFQSGRLVQVEARPEEDEDKNAGGRPSEAIQEAESFLLHELGNNKRVPAHELLKKAKELNISRSTLYRGAKNLGIHPSAWEGWFLPEVNATKATVSHERNEVLGFDVK